MPNLPTLTVTDVQLARCIAVFGDALTYKTWLRERLRVEIVQHELAAVADRQNAEQAVIVADVNATALP